MKTLFILAIMLIGLGKVSAQTTTKTTRESTSVSVNNNDNSYSMTANFNPERMLALKSLIIKKLGPAGKSTNNHFSWKLNDAYTISLRSEKLDIKLNKTKASASVYRMMVQLGEDLQTKLTN